MRNFLPLFCGKKLIALFGLLLLLFGSQYASRNFTALAQSCSLQSFTIEPNTQGRVNINQDLVFKIQANGCSSDNTFRVHYQSGPNACKKGDHILGDPDGDGTFVSDTFSFLTGEETGGQNCVYKQDDFNTTVTFPVQAGKIPPYTYFSQNLVTQYKSAGSPAQWDQCQDGYQNVLNLKDGLKTNIDVYACVDDAVKARYQSCQDTSKTYDANTIPSCSSDSTLTLTSEYNYCDFTFNGASEPQIDTGKYVCDAGRYACRSGGQVKCQAFPAPILSVPSNIIQGEKKQIRVLGCVNTPTSDGKKVRLYINGSEKASQDPSASGNTFEQVFPPGTYTMYATCNNGKKTDVKRFSVASLALAVSVSPCAVDAASCPDPKIYSGKPFYITVKDSSGKVVNTSGALACSGLDAELSNNETLHLSTNNSSSIYTPGSYSLTVYCFSGRMKDEGRIADGTASFEVVDASTVIPDDLKDKPGACEICHPDWPAYDATQQDVNSRCRGSDIATDEKYNRTLRPIKTDTCTKGYVCNHLIGCVIPTGGIKPPPQPCKRGVKFVKEAAPVGGGVAVTREVETTDPKEIDKCLEFDTGVSVLGLDPGAFISSVFSVLLSLSGMIALYLIIRSGYRMMTSRGNPEAIQEARERLVSAIVGLLLIIFSLVALSVIGVNLLRIPGFGS